MTGIIDNSMPIKKYKAKIKRCLQILNKDYPETRPTDPKKRDYPLDCKVLFLGNIGHTTGYDESAVLCLLLSYTANDGVTVISILSGKQYSFVQYRSPAYATAACQTIIDAITSNKKKHISSTATVDKTTNVASTATDDNVNTAAVIAYADAAPTTAVGKETSTEVTKPGMGNECHLIPVYVSCIGKIPEKCSGEVVYKSPPGLTVLDEFISLQEEQELLQLLDWHTTPSGAQLGSSLKQRQVRHFGYQFEYGSNSIDVSKPLLDAAIPTQLNKLIDRMLSRGVLSSKPDQITVNRYLPGQGIPAHIDTHSACTEELSSLSVGSAVVMDFTTDNISSDKCNTDDSTTDTSDDNRSTDNSTIDINKEAAVKSTNTTVDSECGTLNTDSTTEPTSDTNNKHTSNCFIKDDVQKQLQVQQRQKSSHYAVFLPQRSLCIMLREARYSWRHGIKSRKTDVYRDDYGRLALLHRRERISFTFRKTRDTPCTCQYHEYCDSYQGSHKKSGSNGAGKKVRLVVVSSDAASIEAQHVQAVYDNIAPHFSTTRHKPWPNVKQFVCGLPAGGSLLDVGCGNGKYLGLNNDIVQMGCDASAALLAIASGRGHETLLCNCLELPFRDQSFDAVICIAVLHHLASRDRRVAALHELVRVLTRRGRALVYVWAMEQRKAGRNSSYLKQNKKNCYSSCNLDYIKDNYGSSSVSGCETAGKDDVDNLKDGGSRYETSDKEKCSKKEYEGISEPSNLESCYDGNEVSNETNKEESTLKYNENNLDSTESAGKCSDRIDSVCIDNIKSRNASQLLKSDSGTSMLTLPVHENRTNFTQQDMLVPWKLKSQSNGKHEAKSSDEQKVFHRFYHTFQEGELEELCHKIETAQIVKSYYDEGNWCVILQRNSTS